MLVRTNHLSNGGKSRKLLPTYSGLYVTVKVLDHNSYVVEGLKGTFRSLRKYKGIVTLDKLMLITLKLLQNQKTNCLDKYED